MAAETQPTPTPDLSNSTKPNIAFTIWPPSQRTRDAVTNRLIETLSTPSVLSKRYGTIPETEATTIAKLIEEEAFAVASGSASENDDGIEVLQGYSKEISKRMLETVKSRSETESVSVSEIVNEAEVKTEEGESVEKSD